MSNYQTTLPGPVWAQAPAQLPKLLTAVYNSTQPTLADGQVVALQTDNRGNLLVAATFSGTISGNAAASATGSGVPAAADYIGWNDGGNLVGVSAAKPLPISGNITASNPSVSATGAAIPSSATMVGGSDGTNLNALLVESASHPNLRVGIYQGANEATVTAGNALKVDGSSVTQPVSGTVTANAGTNLNTSLLALESGGNLATIAGAISASIAQANIAKINGVTPLMGNGTTGTGSLRVTVASDNTAFSVNNTLVAATAPASTTMQNAATGNGNGTNLSVAGYGVAIVSVTASVGMSGGTTINFEASTDNTTFVSVLANTVGTSTLGTTTVATGDYQVHVAGYSFLRARISAYSAGTITIKGWPIALGAAQPVINANVIGTVTVAQATASSLNATVVGTGTFAVQAAQSGTWNITNISGTVSLPTGAATAAKQPALGTAGSPSADVITIQGAASMTKLLVTPDANSAINLAQVAGSTTATSGTGIQKVGVVGSAGGAFDAATNAAPPANAVQVGMVAATALPSAYTATDLVPPMTDKFGRQVVVANSVRDLVGTATLSSSSSSAVSFIAAGGSGVFNDITSLIITNSSGTATTVTLSDNGSSGNTYLFDIAANGGISIPFPTPLPQGTANAAWDVLNSAGVALHYTAVFVKNK